VDLLAAERDLIRRYKSPCNIDIRTLEESRHPPKRLTVMALWRKACNESLHLTPRGPTRTGIFFAAAARACRARAVLPTAGQLKQGNKIIEEYKRRTGIEKGLEIRKAKIRLCECGATLPSGAQYCERCQKEIKQKRYRRYRDRKRNVSRATKVDILPSVSIDESKT
jgi:hypothetical protein